MLQNFSIHLIRKKQKKQEIFYLQIPKNKSQDQVLPPIENKYWNLWEELNLEVVDSYDCNLQQDNIPRCKI